MPSTVFVTGDINMNKKMFFPKGDQKLQGRLTPGPIIIPVYEIIVGISA